MIPILQTEQHWVCPNCTVTDLTYNKEQRFHNCRGLKSLTAPMVLEGVKCKVEAVERGDYAVNDDLVRLDGEGRAVMAVETTRDEGNDIIAFADCASIDVRMD